MTFERRFSDIEGLRARALFRNCLLPDIVNTFHWPERGRDVFPAIRKERIDFYYKGGLLFSYRKGMGFTTHNKYASVIKSPKSYVTDEDLKAISNFVEGYERIKENCSLHSGIEAQSVSRVYGNFSCAKQTRKQHVVVLDIEISLRRDDEDCSAEPAGSRAKSDRLDLLLFDTENGLLRFFEAKDFSNKEVHIPSHEPKIVKQMNRYEKQLKKARVREEMLAAYRTHVEVINRLFNPDIPLPVPTDIDPSPRLLLFGYDREQLTGKLQDEIARLEQEFGLHVYSIGNIKAVKPHALFSGGNKRWQGSSEQQ